MYGKPDEIQDQAARDVAAAVRSAVAYAKQLKGELDAVHKLNMALRNENAGLVAERDHFRARAADLEGELQRQSTRVLPL